MDDFDFDLFVIGAGSAGVRASRHAAALGARVAVAESGPLGGTCVNAGCIPKKLLAYAADFRGDYDDSAGFGWSWGVPSFEWRKLIERKNLEIQRLNRVYAGLLERSGVTVFADRATIIDPHRVLVAGESRTARTLLVACGGKPVRGSIEGAELGITSDEAFHLERFPERIVIVGAGYVAVEFASIFAGLGAQVTLLCRGEVLLKEFDSDLGKFLAGEMKKHNIDIRFRTRPSRISRTDSGLQCATSAGDSIPADQVMLATGRAPNTQGLGLVESGVELGPDGRVIVNEQFRTSVPSIFAIGDVIGRVQLTPVALAEATLAVDHILDRQPKRVLNYDEIPTAIFSHPNVGSVGLGEAEARARGHEVAVYRSTFTPLKHTLSDSGEKSLMKLVVDATTDRVLGAHMVGADAGETIQGIAIALRCKATKADFDNTIGIHPTGAEEFVTMRLPVEPGAQPEVGWL